MHECQTGRWIQSQQKLADLARRPNRPPGSQTRTGGRWDVPPSSLKFPQINSRHLILKEVDCQRRSAKAVIDTGSGISLISPAFCRILGIENFREWEGPQLLLANGDPLVLEGSVKFKCL
jgi:hypothetical protein